MSHTFASYKALQRLEERFNKDIWFLKKLQSQLRGQPKGDVAIELSRNGYTSYFKSQVECDGKEHLHFKNKEVGIIVDKKGNCLRFIYLNM